MNIQSIPQVLGPSAARGVVESAGPSLANETKSTFKDVMIDVAQSANQELLQADIAIADYESGKTNDLNSVVMASVKADLSFRFLMEMRNRVTESYQELSRMQF